MIRWHKSQLNPLSQQFQDQWPSITKKLFEAWNQKNATSTPAISHLTLKQSINMHSFFGFILLPWGVPSDFQISCFIYLKQNKNTLKQPEPRILPHSYNLSPNFTVALPALNLTALYKQFAFIKSFPSIRLNFHGNDDSITFLVIFHQYCNIYLIL